MFIVNFNKADKDHDLYLDGDELKESLKDLK